MLKREKNNLEQLITEAKLEGCTVVRRIGSSDEQFAFITDAKSMLVASEDGHIIIPLEIIPEFIESLKISTKKAIEYEEYFTLADKEKIARSRKLTYGKHQGKLKEAYAYCKRI